MLCGNIIGGCRGGQGGGAVSTLTVTDAFATSLNGTTQSIGGNGGSAWFPGNGGDAMAYIALTSTRTGVDVNSTATAQGGAPGTGFNSFFIARAGAANATAIASAVGSGAATANATASGTGTGAAAATSTSNGPSGQSIVASATSPIGGPASAFTQTTFGGSVSLPTATNPGQSYSVINAFVDAHPPILASGAMGAGYGGSGEPLTYEESADLNLSGHGTLRLGFLGTISVGTGFDSSTIQIFVNGNLFLSQTFNDLASANNFFTNNVLKLDQFHNEMLDVRLLYDETMSSSNEAFGFTYTFATTGAIDGVPEPSTWAMMLLGFAGLGFAFRRSRRKAAFA
jgi:hypothetical protein